MRTILIHSAIASLVFAPIWGGLAPLARAQEQDFNLTYTGSTNTVTTMNNSVATSTGTNTTAGTSTQTSTDTKASIDPTGGANCHNSGATYGNGSFSHCTKADNQQNSQKDTKELNDSGSQKAMMLGMMATAAGAGMVAAGMAQTPTPNYGLISAGTQLIAQGMQGIMAAGKMAQNSGYAGWNDYQMGALPNWGTPDSSYTPPTGSSTLDPGSGAGSGGSTNNPDSPVAGTPGTNNPATTPGTGTGSSGNPGGIKIDDSFTRTGRAASIFDDFEKKTGIDRNELLNGLQNGKSAADILGGNGKMKMSAADLQNAINNASGASLGADGLMGKLGLTPEELAAMGKNTSMNATGDQGALALGGPSSAGAGRGLASANIDGLFSSGNEKTEGEVGALGSNLSPDIQAALERNGITDQSIFQMVHKRYKTRTPTMLGESKKRPQAVENPFASFGSNEKIEF